MFYKACVIFFGCIILVGCFGREKMQAINTLNDLAKERSAQETVIRKEKRQFARLIGAIKKGTLKIGMDEEEILRVYGEPVLVKDVSGGEGRLLIFGEPLKYFGAKKAYLYFDEGGKLSSWEVK